MLAHVYVDFVTLSIMINTFIALHYGDISALHEGLFKLIAILIKMLSIKYMFLSLLNNVSVKYFLCKCYSRSILYSNIVKDYKQFITNTLCAETGSFHPCQCHLTSINFTMHFQTSDNPFQ